MSDGEDARELKIRRLNADAQTVLVAKGSSVADLKKLAAEDLGIPWLQQKWTDSKEEGSILQNHVELDVSSHPEVLCIAVPEGIFPFDSGKFDKLIVSGVIGLPIWAEPGEDGKLVVAGEDPGEEPIDDAVVLEDRLLTIKGDGETEQDDPYVTAAWSEAVHLDPDLPPIIVGWRVRYLSNGWPGPRFGLTTKESLEKIKTGSVETIFNFMTKDDKTSCVRAGTDHEVHCTSVYSAGPGEATCLDITADGGYEYDVLIVYDSTKKEIRASVGWGIAGSRIDKAVVDREHWPGAELELIPVLSLVHEDFCGMNNIEDPEQLPITVEALTKEQMAESALDLLLKD